MMRTRLFAKVLACCLLGGCSFSDQIQRNFDQAQALAVRCDALNQEPVVASWPALVARMKARLSLACSEAGACPMGIKDQVAELQKTLAAPELSAVRDRLRTFGAALDAFQKSVDGYTAAALARRDLTDRWTDAARACRYAAPSRCDQQIRAVLQELASLMKETDAAGTSMRGAWSAVAGVWNGVRESLDAAAPRLTATQRELVGEIGNLVAAERESISAMSRVAVHEFRRDFFDRLLPTYTAEKVLDFTERQFEPLDRLVDKMDDKFYFIGSTAIEMNRAAIQDRFDSFYVTYVRDRFPSTGSARAFARAACAKLGKPTAAGKAVSIITPFLYSSMTLIDLESQRKDQCMESAGSFQGCEAELMQMRAAHASSAARAREGSADKPQAGSLEEELRDKLKPGNTRQVAAPSAQAAASAPQSSAMEDPAVFEQCLVAERVFQRRLALTNQRAGNDTVRHGAQEVCAEVLLRREQQAFSDAATGGGAAVPGPAQPEVSKEAFESQIARQTTAPIQLNVTATFTVSPLAPPMPQPSLCQSMGRALGSSSCIDDATSADIGLAGSFRSGRFAEPDLVPTLRVLGRAIAAYAPATSAIVITGSASAARLSCRQLRAVEGRRNPCASVEPGVAAIGCTDDAKAAAASAGTLLLANALLARDRACWAKGVLLDSSPQLGKLMHASAAHAAPQPGNQAFDRTISLRIETAR